MNLQSIIDSACESLDEKLSELDGLSTGLDIRYLREKILEHRKCLKSHLISSIKKAVEEAYKEIEVEKRKHKFEIPISAVGRYGNNLPETSEEKSRVDSFNSALSLIEKKKSLFLHECCDGECNHDDCCGKVEANCPLKDNK